MDPLYIEDPLNCENNVGQSVFRIFQVSNVNVCGRRELMLSPVSCCCHLSPVAVAVTCCCHLLLLLLAVGCCWHCCAALLRCCAKHARMSNMCWYVRARCAAPGGYNHVI